MLPIVSEKVQVPMLMAPELPMKKLFPHAEQQAYQESAVLIARLVQAKQVIIIVQFKLILLG